MHTKVLSAMMLGNLDPALRSKLESISLIALFNTNLLTEYSIDEGKLVAFLVGEFKEGVGMAMRKCWQCMATYDQRLATGSYVL